MKEIKRYLVSGSEFELTQHPDGDYVEFDDHDAIVAENDGRISALMEEVRMLAAENSRFISRINSNRNSKVRLMDKLSTDAAIREIRAQAIDYASGELQSLATRADDVVAERYIDFAAIYLMGMSKKLRSGEQP